MLVDTLIDCGIQVVFGLPGDGINGLIGALRTRQDRIRCVQVRHEEAAAFMACGLPYAVAYPQRQVVVFVGDGGLTMLMGELATCVKYGLNVKVIVIKNNTLGQIKWEQIVFLGNPEFGCELQPIDFVEVARACGAQGFRIDDPAECGDVLERALAVSAVL